MFSIVRKIPTLRWGECYTCSRVKLVQFTHDVHFRTADFPYFDRISFKFTKTRNARFCIIEWCWDNRSLLVFHLYLKLHSIELCVERRGGTTHHRRQLCCWWASKSQTNINFGECSIYCGTLSFVLAISVLGFICRIAAIRRRFGDHWHASSVEHTSSSGSFPHRLLEVVLHHDCSSSMSQAVWAR